MNGARRFGWRALCLCSGIAAATPLGSCAAPCANVARKTPPTSDLDRLCIEPGKPIVNPPTADELAAMLRGRWYACGSARYRIGDRLPVPAIGARKKEGKGIEFDGTRWHLLGFGDDGGWARFEPEDIDDRYEGGYHIEAPSMRQVRFPVPDDLRLAVQMPRLRFGPSDFGEQPKLFEGGRVMTLSAIRFVAIPSAR